jgi:hypothetical protein
MLLTRSKQGLRIVERPQRLDGYTEESFGNICNGQNFKNTRDQIKKFFFPEPEFTDFESFFDWIDELEKVGSAKLLLLDFSGNQ